MADRARDAPEEVRLDLAAPGVPQDDPRHGRARTGCPTTASRLGAGDVVVVRARGRLSRAGQGQADPRLGAEAHARARAAAPGYDPYWLEAEWLRFWRARGRPALRSPEAAFLAFARARAARAPQR